MANHDFCSGCNLGGPLLYCDYCTASYHLLCLNPPLHSVPKGKWACMKCSQKNNKTEKKEKIPDTLFKPLVKRLRETNPIEFAPSEEIKELLNFTTTDPIGKRGPKKKRPKAIQSQFHCFTCKKELFTTRSDWVTCSKCVRSFHLYCLQPILYKKPNRGWYCSHHEPLYNSFTHYQNFDDIEVPCDTCILPDDSITLDFFPYSSLPEPCRKKMRPNRKTASFIPENNKDVMELSSQKMLANLSNQQATNDLFGFLMKGKKYEQMSEYVNVLETEQKKLFTEVNNNLKVDPSVNSLMSQFMAWQRLMQVNNELEHLEYRKLQGNNIWTTLDEYFDPIESDDYEEEEEEEEEDNMITESNTELVMDNQNLVNSNASLNTESSLDSPAFKSKTPLNLSNNQIKTSTLNTSVNNGTNTTAPVTQNNPFNASTLNTLSQLPPASNPVNFAFNSNIYKPPSTPLTPPTLPISNNRQSQKEVSSLSVSTDSIKKKANDPKIRVTIRGEDVKETTCELEPTSSIVIGRADPRMPIPEGLVLDLNLHNYLSTPAVRKVSHKHAEIQKLANKYYILCHGRNGMQVDGVWIPKSRRVPLENNQVLTLGPFSLTINVDSV